MRRLLLVLAAAATLAPVLPASARAAPPTVRSELVRLVATGALDPNEGLRLRDLYADARRTLRGLEGARRAQLAAVLATTDALARRRQLAVGRLRAVFLTLETNRAWWASSRPLAPGERVTLPGSQIVWQFYPGQGLQIQWLGTFGKANALFHAGRLPALGALLDEALPLAVPRAGGLAFESLFPYAGGRPPWVSGLSQGTALSALARGGVALGRPDLLSAGEQALGIFTVAPPEGVRIATDAGAHFLQYSAVPALRVLNGFVQALNGLHDFATLAASPRAQALFAAGEAELRTELPAFDTGAWSLYSSAGTESDLSYHVLLRDFLQGLCTRMAASADAAPYCAAAQRFTADLTTAPLLSLRTRTLRPRREGTIRLTLSKVSTVSLTVLRDGVVVLARSARLGRGTRTFAITPRKAGPLEVRLHATDLAGNGADATGVVAVTRRGTTVPPV